MIRDDNQQIALFGGASGILNEGKLSSSLARPQNLYAYKPNVNLYELAAAYGWGLAKNHLVLEKRSHFHRQTCDHSFEVKEPCC